MTVTSCHPENGTVKCRCQNTAMLGERKNVNLPGVVVDLPTITEVGLYKFWNPVDPPIA
jgi:pyruvate kinase